MRKLLNTLFIDSPDSYLCKEGNCIVVKEDRKVIFKTPVNYFESIVCFAYAGASPALMEMCVENRVGISFLNEHGRFYGRVSGKTKGNVLLRREQYRKADNAEECLSISKNFIIGKIVNCNNVLKRVLRDHGEKINADRVKVVSEKLTAKIPKIEDCLTTDELRGIEGDAAKEYYSVFNELILYQKNDFTMHGRSKRPPLDNVNTLLSFLYTVLAHEVQNALETVGLDPYVGYLHTDRPGRASLALDMMEELRPYLADRLVLTMINLKQINGKGFIQKESGGVILDKETRREVLKNWQKKTRESIEHPFINEKIEIGLIPYVQALLMARYIRGDLESYPPFLMK